MPAIERDIYSQFKAHATFLCVYIEEAHAMDEWPISSARYNKGVPVNIRQPKTDQERMKVAQEFRKNFQLTMPLCIDPPELNNPFEKAYAPWPLRMFCIENGKVSWIAQPKNCEYDAGELRGFLDQRFATK
jgi:hypothetical protein